MIQHRIPDSIKEDIIETVDFCRSFVPILPDEQEKYLFRVYNMYVKPTYKEDLAPTCSACINEVWSKLRTIVNTWKDG